MTDSTFRMALDAARRTIGLSIDELWIRYFALGGNDELIDVDGYLSGVRTLSIREHNVLTLALNEAFDELGMDHPLGYREGT